MDCSLQLRYPSARQLKRRIVMHVGPTNSGKTYSALQSFLKAHSGIYCGPLRLLAHEVFEKVWPPIFRVPFSSPLCA